MLKSAHSSSSTSACSELISNNSDGVIDGNHGEELFTSTSKLAIISTCSILISLSLVTKWLEFLMHQCDHATKGERISLRCFDRWYRGEPIVIIIGLIGMSSLWIFNLVGHTLQEL